MRLFEKLLFATALLLAPTLAFAAKGVVVYYESGCSYFIVETNLGYALLEWYGGHDPSKGEIIAGDFESFGFKNVYNLTADRETKVWVDNFWLSKSRAIEKYYDKCD
ncbi:hypothetical protein G7069_04310 [Lysobacter sp. HDW10]|uniref:hypothetical protein n=1 Tax=Lysobacter sp. HDW10 TaxID=2714936 RepID=UPI00140801B1|nr:hypothetical protein [Lysobacter sp. HDW10]QIK80891.1 hypothetical protein G7069_04310 [Lysobacter sp. HDW10]